MYMLVYVERFNCSYEKLEAVGVDNHIRKRKAVGNIQEYDSSTNLDDIYKTSIR